MQLRHDRTLRISAQGPVTLTPTLSAFFVTRPPAVQFQGSQPPPKPNLSTNTLHLPLIRHQARPPHPRSSMPMCFSHHSIEAIIDFCYARNCVELSRVLHKAKHIEHEAVVVLLRILARTRHCGLLTVPFQPPSRIPYPTIEQR